MRQDCPKTYNQARGYTPEQIRTLQLALKLQPTAKWDDATIAAVEQFQRSKALKVDGMVGPKTWDHLLDVIDPPTKATSTRPIIGCGLAAYDQKWPGYSTFDAMQSAYDAALGEQCREIRYWSSEWVLQSHGNKSNSYAGKFLKALQKGHGTELGFWIDDPKRELLKPSYWDALQGVQADLGALMINRSNTRSIDVPWDPRFEIGDLAKITALMRCRQITPVLTVWPRPSRSQIDAMLSDLVALLDAAECRTLEVDTEGNWHPRFLHGFGNMREAAQYLAEGMRVLVGTKGVCELTTYPYHEENSSKAQLAPLMDRLLPQAYSVRHRGNEVVPYGSRLGPGRMQALAVSRAREAAQGG